MVNFGLFAGDFFCLALDANQGFPAPAVLPELPAGVERRELHILSGKAASIVCNDSVVKFLAYCVVKPLPFFLLWMDTSEKWT